MSYCSLLLTRFRLISLVTGFVLAALPIYAADQPEWRFSGDLSARARANAEVLAMRETTDLRLDPALVAEIAADLERIYAYDPGLAAAPASGPFVLGEVLIGVTDEVSDELSNGTFEPWKTLREQFPSGQAEEIFSVAGSKIWHISIEEPLNAIVLADWIQTNWPGVRFAEPNGTIADASDIERSPELRWYAFILKWGDCPSGCIHQERRVIAIEDGATVEEIDTTEAQSRLEVVTIDYPEEISARVGDKIHLRGQATLTHVARANISVDGVMQWASRRPDGEWRSAGSTYTIFRPGSFEREWRVEVVEPVSRATWFFPQSLTRIESESDALTGDRYGDHWLSLPLGWVNDRNYPWIWTAGHGWWWLNEEASSKSSAWWTYDLQLGWLYIPMNSQISYPFIHSGGRWLYYRPGSHAPREFYDYAANAWIGVE